MFLQCLAVTGLKRVRDLCIYSDRGKAIGPAVKEVFPNCEHVPCAVHLERDIQNQWEKNYGKLSRRNEEMIDSINHFIDCFRLACISTTEKECKSWLQAMKEEEEEGAGGSAVYEYVKKFEGVFMWKWKYNHLMERTSNPAESCMAVLKRNMTGMGCAREGSFFNRYRVLLIWLCGTLQNRMEQLRGGKMLVPLYGVKRDSVCCPWALKRIIKKGHWVETYKEELRVEPCEWRRSTTSEKWDGEYGDVLEGNKGLYHYRVIDRAHGMVHYVSLESRHNPCTCHSTYWEKIPCIHVIRVLHWREEHWRVWEYVGKEYSFGSVKKTVSGLSRDEMRFIEWLYRLRGTQTDNSGAIARARPSNDGRNAKRVASTGEMPVSSHVPPYE